MIVNFVPTGLLTTREQHPSIPLSPAEIIDEVGAALEIGINMVHLHARDGKGQPTCDRAIMGEIISEIRKLSPALIICASLSGRRACDFAERTAILDLTGDQKPDMGSLTLSSMNFAREASVNSPDTVIALAEKMHAVGVKPELEIFDLGMANAFLYLRDRGYLKPPFYANLMLGGAFTAQPTPAQLAALLADLPENTLWSAGGIGRSQLPANALAIACGGGVRIGLEDNLFWDAERTRMASNCELLQRVHQLAELQGRSLTPASELRVSLEL